VPDTVQAVVAARIDLLAPAENEALQAASVIGRIFWSGPVYELCPETEPNLRLLEERDFIRLRLGSSIEGEREYAIKHAVTREVAYTSIPRARRAHLHAAFAPGSSASEEGATSTHHYWPTITRKRVALRTPTWPGPERRTSSRVCACERSPGCDALPSSPSVAMKSTKDSST
jgi:hypothetical protein